MKTLQTISGLSAKSGGPSTCTLDLLNGLYDIHAGVDLLTVSSPDILGAGSPWMKLEPCDYKTPLGISKNIKRALLESDYDLYHANTLWSYTTHETCKVARAKRKPYVISPHGMLYPTALAIKRWKKIPMLNLWFNKDIMQASCLHATCQQEAKYCRQFGYKGPIAVIPNAVVFPIGVDLKGEDLELRDDKGRRQIGFLGRLHPIKKVENVLYALSYIAEDIRKGINFQIMGKYDDQYEQWLKDEVRRLGLEDCVEFVGVVSGKEKYDRLSKLSVLMVPSTQENFGMIVPEALICGTPVYASLGTPWEELKEWEAGWWLDNSPEIIAKVIQDILSKSDAELRAMGAKGRKLIEEKYEQHKVARMMVELYKWINGEGQKPKFVYDY